MKTIRVTLLGVVMTGLMSLQTHAQSMDDDVLVKIGNEKITKSEFLNIYRKNNVNNEVIDKKSLEEYLELYINFKMKVMEAESLGMDTVLAFIQELDGYRRQLAQPYLTDETATEKLIREAYDRMRQDVRASHILIRLASDAPPADTLAAYQKIMDISRKIAEGTNFGDLAVTYSDDPSSKDRPASPNRPPMKGNRGDLGYFTVFDMVYPFENGAYNTPVGKVSRPVRTDFGYHLIKVTDKKEAMGKVQVAHILITLPPESIQDDSLRLKEKAMAAYQEILDGMDFSDVVKKYSDDKGTSEKGGVLPYFGVNRMIPEFISEVSHLEEIGEVSPPFLTAYGWHIVKLIDKKGIGTFDEVQSEIKQKIARNDRAKVSRESFINKLKSEYGFTEYPENLAELLCLVNDSLIEGTWDPGAAIGMTKFLFEIDNNGYTQEDFSVYLAKNQKGISDNVSVENAVHSTYKKFVDEQIMAYEDSRLEEKYHEFGMLMKEYRDGILLFELTDKMVWSKAIQDTTGLEQYYEANKNHYMWGPRVDATVYSVTSPKQVKTVRKLVSKGISNNDILDRINDDSLMILSIISDKFQAGDHEVIDSVEWFTGISENVVINGVTSFAVIHHVLDPEPKLLSETRGIITADYQNFLEQEWILVLRRKYPFEINQAVLESIK